MQSICCSSALPLRGGPVRHRFRGRSLREHPGRHVQPALPGGLGFDQGSVTRASGEPETSIYQTTWKRWTPKSAPIILYRHLVANWPCSIDYRVCAVRSRVSEESPTSWGGG